MTSLLRDGSKGDNVKRLQALLNKKVRPRPNLVEDGLFGPATEKAVRRYQAQKGLGIDGIVGPETWKSLENAGRSGFQRVNTSAAGQAKWMAIAMKEMGQSEIGGIRHNARIVEYHATTTLKATDDETPWCSSFVNWALIQAGIKGTNSAAAASWLKWGKTTGAKKGAITVIRNDSAANSNLTYSGNHVAFLLNETDTHYHLLGGNQSDQVKISRYPKSAWSLRGYRWPIA